MSWHIQLTTDTYIVRDTLGTKLLLTVDVKYDMINRELPTLSWEYDSLKFAIIWNKPADVQT